LPEIGIRELKKRISQVVREVKERRVRYIIQVWGKTVAMLVPADLGPPQPDPDEVWDRLERLGKAIAQQWNHNKSAVELLSQMRQ
jgi:prevent-host-death family protein